MTQVFTEVLKKKELVDGFSEFSEMNKKESEATLDTVFAYLEEVLYTQKKGFKLGGIGTHKVSIVPEREHPIPKSTEKITKPRHYAPKFKPNDGFKKDMADLPVEEI